MSYLKDLVVDAAHDAWQSGWDACESFYEQMILNRDPAFREWLDALDAEGQRIREEQILADAEAELARRNAAGEPLI